ncbi:MAG: hypothetical protein RR033_03070 [Clostridia bacterium]
MKTFNNDDYKNVFRYLNILSPQTSDYELVSSMYEILKTTANPKHVVRVCDTTVQDGEYFIEELELNLKSNSLTEKFNNIDKIAVTASTLGADVDKKIKYYSAIDILKATFLDALASVLIENELDELEFELHNTYPTYQFSMRFSCGYDDLSLELQPKIIKSLNATKLIGISVNSANLMSPMKSITSFIGLSKLSKNASTNYTDIDVCSNCNLNGKCVTKCRRATQYGK